MIEWELAKGARRIVEYVCNLQAGENVLIYADTAADQTVVNYIAEAAYSAGGGPQCYMKPGQKSIWSPLDR